MSPYEAEYARLMDVYTQVVSFLVGLCIGSFLNVVIARVPEGLSLLRPGSRCPRCHTPIRWYDNIPVVSWLVLLGRCRQCKAPISPRYPTVELLVGLLALALAQRYGVNPLGVSLFIFVCILVAVSYMDLDYWIIPLELVIPGIALGIVTSAVFNHDVGWRDSLIGAVAGFAVFWLINMLGTLAFKRPALGEGDWWLIAMIGAYLGWKALLPVILLASLQGSIVGGLLLLAGRGESGAAPEQVPAAPGDTTAAPPTTEAVASSSSGPGSGVQAGEKKEGADSSDEEEDNWVPPKHAVPFGPFLALAGLEQLFLGDWLRDLYWHLVSKLAG